MAHSNSHGAGAFAAGVLFGSVVGAAVALLCAPKSGAALRGDISESASSVRQAVTNRYESLARQTGLRLHDIEAHTERAVRFVETSARDLVEAAKGRTRRSARPSDPMHDGDV